MNHEFRNALLLAFAIGLLFGYLLSFKPMLIGLILFCLQFYLCLEKLLKK